MRIRLTDPAHAPELLAFLRRRVDVIAAQVDDGVLEVSILGSRRQPANVRELERRLRGWPSATGVEILAA